MTGRKDLSVAVWPHVGFCKLEIIIYFYSLLRFECNDVMNYFCKHPSWQNKGGVWIGCFNLIPAACFNTLSVVYSCSHPCESQMQKKSVSDLHTYVPMSHQRGPLCVMLFSQFPFILCSCHPNLMTMFYLPSCQLSLLLCSYAVRRILCRPTTKGSSFVWNCRVCTCMPDWIMFFVFEGCLSGGWLDLRWGWVNYT